MGLFDRNNMRTMDFRYGRDDRYSPDYASLYGDGSGVGDARVGGLLGNITQSIGDAMVDDKGLFQGGKKNRMFGRVRDWWEGDEGEPIPSQISATPDSAPDSAPDNTYEEVLNEGAEDVNRKYPSWHPWSKGAPEDNDMGRVKPGQNIFARNVESGDEDMGRVAPGENIFDRGLGEDIEDDGSSIFDYQKPYVAPEYNETPYVAPQYNETPYVAPQYGTTNYNAPQYKTSSFNRADSGKNSNYPYDTSNPGFQYAQSLLGSIPGYETTNPSKVDAEITDNATNVFNSTRGQDWMGQ